jgi:multidrug resistance efflux pump
MEKFSVENAILKTIQSADVAAQVSGVVYELRAKEGDLVVKGALLGKIHDAAVLLQIEKAKLAIETAKLKEKSTIDIQAATKSAAVAMNELQRALKANQRVPDTYPPTEVDRLQLVSDRSVLEVERAQEMQALAKMEVLSASNELAVAEELAQRHRITAPCDGVVVTVDKHAGEWIDLGGRLLQLVSTGRLRIEGFIDVEKADETLNGAEAEVSVARTSIRQPVSEPIIRTPKTTKTATVVFVGSEANPVNGKVRVFLEVDNADGRLHPGQRVDVVIRRAKP